MNNKKYQHWQLNQDEQNILWLGFSRQDQSVNTINLEVLNELADIIADIKKQNPQGVILHSLKEKGFIAGADIEQFKTLDASEQVAELIHRGHEVFQQWEELNCPTLAMINGFCMGGGLELSLVCRYRIAQDCEATRLGLPEVRLGIHPGWGGCVRLPRLIGAPAAMDLILSGRAIRATAAKRLGLVDAVVPARHLKRAAQQIILTKPKPQRAKWWQALTNQQFLRPVLAKFLTKKVMKKAQPAHYPAPFAVIENWQRYGISKQALQVEADSIIDLILHHDTPKNLVRVFFLQEQLKTLAKDSDFNPKHIHVIGSGVMGGDIAAWCALQGFYVTLQDREATLLSSAIARAYKTFKKKLKKPRLVQAAMDRLVPDVAGSGIVSADVIIEAIFEDLQAKQDLFKSVEAQAKPEAILATNTSSIPLDEINQVLKTPQRLVGLHFFNPVALMPLIEVVQGKKTQKTIVNKMLSFARQLDRLPLPVKSNPGFLVNRVLMPYLMTAIELFNEGIPAPVIDKVARDFGMPMGPVELADKIGLDVCLSVAEHLTPHFGGEVPPQLIAKVSNGELGCKTNKGFYQYKKGKLIPEKIPQQQYATTEISDKLINSLLNEAKACLKEQVVDSADLLDAGMIFGTGFAPFRGGPMHYAEQRLRS